MTIQQPILIKLCLLVLVGAFSLSPISGASFFIDGQVGCKTSSYGTEFYNVSLSCKGGLCRVGSNFTLKADLEVGSRLPTVVKVIPKICHANGYSCTGTLNNYLSRNLCKSLTPQWRNQTCPQKGPYKLRAKMKMINNTKLQSYMSSGSNKFILKAQLKPQKTTYEFYMAQQAIMDAAAAAEAGEGDDQQQQEEEEEEEDDEVEDAEEEEEEDTTEPTDSLFCHIPLRYTSNDRLNVTRYFEKKAASRSWNYQNQTEDQSEEATSRSIYNTDNYVYASVGVVAFLMSVVSVAGVKRRRNRTEGEVDAEDASPCSPTTTQQQQGATTDFVVFDDQPPKLILDDQPPKLLVV